MYICIYTALTCTFDVAAFLEIFGTRPKVDTRGKGYAPAIQTVPFRDPSCMGFSALFIYNTDPQAGWGLGGGPKAESWLELKRIWPLKLRLAWW